MSVDASGSPVCRGIISYYATLTMREATDMRSWVDLMRQRSGKDLAQHKINMLQDPRLQICGDPGIEVIGERRFTEPAERA
jgi:hypothetical protein